MNHVVSIGGMRLKHWTGYFRIILPTLRTLRAARAAPDCIHADTFKEGDAFFAMSVWRNEAAMKNFAATGIHGELRAMASDHMAFFHNHSFRTDEIPSRIDARQIWDAALRL